MTKDEQMEIQSLATALVELADEDGMTPRQLERALERAEELLEEEEALLPVDRFIHLSASDVLPPDFYDTYRMFNQQQEEEDS